VNSGDMRLSGRFEPSQFGLEFEAQLRALVLSEQLILLVVAEEIGLAEVHGFLPLMDFESAASRAKYRPDARQATR
jgi:hypothetical protein